MIPGCDQNIQVLGRRYMEIPWRSNQSIHGKTRVITHGVLGRGEEIDEIAEWQRNIQNLCWRDLSYIAESPKRVLKISLKI